MRLRECVCRRSYRRFGRVLGGDDAACDDACRSTPAWRPPTSSSTSSVEPGDPRFDVRRPHPDARHRGSARGQEALNPRSSPVRRWLQSKVDSTVIGKVARRTASSDPPPGSEPKIRPGRRTGRTRRRPRASHSMDALISEAVALLDEGGDSALTNPYSSPALPPACGRFGTAYRRRRRSFFLSSDSRVCSEFR